MKKKYRILPIGMATLGVATFLVLAIVRLAPSQDPPDPSPAELAQGARRELGFGLGDVLPSMGGQAIHEQMIQAALGAASDPTWAGQELVEECEAARAEVVHRLTWEDDPELGYARLGAAREALMAGSASQLSALVAELPSEHAPVFLNVIANLGLDSDLRALALSAEQREAIFIAQESRDAVLLDARNWHDTDKLDLAREEFEFALDETLTQAQADDLAVIREELDLRMDAMAEAEVTAEES